MSIRRVYTYLFYGLHFIYFIIIMMAHEINKKKKFLHDLDAPRNLQKFNWSSNIAWHNCRCLSLSICICIFVFCFAQKLHLFCARQQDSKKKKKQIKRRRPCDLRCVCVRGLVLAPKILNTHTHTYKRST